MANAIKQEVEHIRTEKERRRSEEEWRKTFNALPDIACLISTEHEFIKVNDYVVAALGMDRDEIIGRKCYELVHGTDEPIEECPCEKALRTGDSHRGTIFEERGRYYTAAAAPILGEDGEIQSLAHSVKDITKRVEAEREASFEKELLDSLLENTPDLVYFKDEKGRYVKASDSFKDQLGVEPDEMVGSDALGVFPGEVGKKFYEEDRKVLENQEPIVGQVVSVKIPGGGNRFFSQVKVPMVSEDGSVKGLFGISRDVTERQEARESLEFMTSLLRHDVSNKITVAKGFTELLCQKELPEDASSLVEKSLNSLKECTNLLVDIRSSMASLEDTEPGTVDINPVIQRTVGEFEEEIRHEGIEVELDVDESKVLGGPLLKRLFSNLVGNAVEHAECDKIRIKSRESGEELIVSVEDDGIGISADEKHEILHSKFEDRKHKGSGLGLNIVRRIVENYGGSLEVKDSELGGARFDVHLEKS